MILTLDLATKTGWAIGDKMGVITSGSIDFAPKGIEGDGMRFLKLQLFLDKLACHNLTKIYYELVQFRHKSVSASHVYGGLKAIVEAWCESRGVPYEGIPVGTIKKHATNKGNANKEDMILAANKRGHKVKDDNEADALALFYYVQPIGVAA